MTGLNWVTNYESESILEKDSLTSREFLYLGKTRHYAEEVGLEDLQQDIEDRMVEYLETSIEELRNGLDESDLPISIEEADEAVSQRDRDLVYTDMYVFDSSREDAEELTRQFSSTYLNGLVDLEGIEFEGEPLVPKELAVE